MRVRADDLEHDLCADVAQQVLDVVAHERVVHNRSPVVCQRIRAHAVSVSARRGVRGGKSRLGRERDGWGEETDSWGEGTDSWGGKGLAGARERTAQDVLKLENLVALVGRDEVGHGQDLGVALVRLGLGRRERVNLRLHEHVGEHEVLEALDAARAAGLVVVFERLEKVLVRLVPLLCWPATTQTQPRTRSY